MFIVNGFNFVGTRNQFNTISWFGFSISFKITIPKLISLEFRRSIYYINEISQQMDENVCPFSLTLLYIDIGQEKKL